MRLTLSSIIVFATFFTFASCTSEEDQTQSVTEETLSNSIQISGAWARPAPKGANSAAYLTIFNGTSTVNTLLSIKTDAAEIAEVHKTYRDENDMMGMRPAGTIVIQPDSSFVLEPGSFHIMLMQLNRELAEGDSLQLTFEFTVSGIKKMMVPVKSMN